MHVISLTIFLNPVVDPTLQSVLDFNEDEQVKLAIAQSLQATASAESDSDDDMSFFDNEEQDLSGCSSNKSLPVNISAEKVAPSPPKEQNGTVGWQQMCEPFKGASLCEIIFRLPEGEKENVSVPSSAPLKVRRLLTNV